MGAAVAASGGAVPVTVILLAGIGALVTFAISAEVALAAVIVTSPYGLENLTGGDRPLLQSFGGWAVSSVRLGVLLLLGLAVLALRGLPRRLVFQEYVYLGLIAWISATLVFSPDLFAGGRFTAKLAVLLVAWLAFGWMVRSFGERFMWRLLLATLAAALLAAYALLATGLNFHHYPDAPSRFAGLAEPASGALSLATLALAALFLWLRERHQVALILYLLAWVPILMSITRIAIFGFAIASLLLAILMGRRLQGMGIALCVTVVLFSFAPLRERMVFGNNAESWQTVAATVQNQGVEGLNTEGRTELWEVLSQEYHDHPIAGSGAGASEAVLRSSSASFSGVVQAHSDYMALLVNGGLIAIALWLLSLGGLAVRFARVRGAASPAAAAIVLYFLAAITDNAIEMYAYLGIPLAALIAIGLAADPGHEGRGHRAPAGV